MNDFKLISNSFGHGIHGKYLSDLESRLGVVVEFFQFEIQKDLISLEAVHMKIASQGMECRYQANEEYFKNVKKLFEADPVRYKKDIFDPSKLGPNDRFCIKYDAKNAKSVKIGLNEFLREYTYAFTEPPYSVNCSEEEITKICSESILKLFGDLNSFEIRKWSTDWSNYFESGNEWWGSFLWTLTSNNGYGWWVGASTTD